MGHTVIQLPVPALESLVRANPLRDAQQQVPADSETICSHITLLGPFVPEQDVDDRPLADLAGFFAAEPPFTFELVDVRCFPGGSRTWLRVRRSLSRC